MSLFFKPAPVIDRLPTDRDYEIAGQRQRDDYYRPPAYVQRFLDAAKPLLPEHYRLEMWSLNRTLTLFHNGEAVQYYPYDSIENHYLQCFSQLKTTVGRF